MLPIAISTGGGFFVKTKMPAGRGVAVRFVVGRLDEEARLCARRDDAGHRDDLAFVRRRIAVALNFGDRQRFLTKGGG
jgi:hypothetical protein